MTPAADPTVPHPAASPASTTRRTVLIGAAGLAADLFTRAAPAAEPAGPPALPRAGEAFEARTLVDLARARAAAPYVAPKADDVPAALKDLTRDGYGRVRARPGRAVWAADGLGYELEPLLRGSIFVHPVPLFLVEDGVVRPVPYAAADYAGDGGTPPEMPAETAFSGFLLRARFGTGAPTDFAKFQGASFFRLVAEGQAFGVTARSLALRPADSRGEEFPLFRALFVERPAADGPAVVHALVESESAVAALRLVLTPGTEASTSDVEATVFARTEIDHLGVGGMQGSYLFGALDRRRVDDVRAGAHTTDGLSVRNGAGEAIWRPVHNPDTLQVSAFVDRDPRGFGLMQRARAYADFGDDLQRWDRRPALWLEPRGNWGEGAVTLAEIPSDAEVNENILAYWRPKAGLAKGAQTTFAYRQFWSKGWPDPLPPNIARVSGTRGGRGTGGEQRRFAVDFTGDSLVPEDGIAVELSAAPGTTSGQARYAYPDRRTLRIVFDLDPGGERASELRLALRRGGERASETWLFRWTP